MRLLITGTNELHVKHAEWALPALGTDYHFETRSIEEAVAEWPLTEYKVAVVVDQAQPPTAVRVDQGFRSAEPPQHTLRTHLR